MFEELERLWKINSDNMNRTRDGLLKRQKHCEEVAYRMAADYHAQAQQVQDCIGAMEKIMSKLRRLCYQQDQYPVDVLPEKKD